MITLVRAAAGCGKTTTLALRYLGFLSEGISADRAVAITFTRRAAAELVERVGLALVAVRGGARGEEARDRLGAAWPSYAAAAPRDPALVEAALHALSTAPIGTTDSFVAALLSEYAVDAALPIPGRPPEPLDIPIRAGRGPASALTRVARRLLDPLDGAVGPEVALLARHYPLEEIRAHLCSRGAADDLPALSCRELLDEVAQALAGPVRESDPATLLGVSDSARLEAWETALRRTTNSAGQWAIPRIARWLHAGCPAPAPWELAAWLHALQRRGPRAKLLERLDATPWNLGTATLTLGEVIAALRFPYEDPAMVDVADSIRSARETLRDQVRGPGLVAAARAGELDYDALCGAAIALAEAPPRRLAHRFGSLLVDEVQDANPLQIRLYRALAALPGVGDRACFVGDVRQGIYLFRGADPSAFADLVSQSACGPMLAINYRSTPALVAAHRALFAPLNALLVANEYPALDSLEGTEAWSFNRQAELDPTVHADPAPVWIIRTSDGTDANEAALAAFLERVQAAWTGEGRPDTAAVLAPTWANAATACRLLQQWTGNLEAACLEGGNRILRGRVADDIRAWIRALTDPADELAWLAVWRHPTIGLSDDALARMRALTSLSHLTERQALDPACAAADREAFARALSPIRHALALAPAGRLAEGLNHLAAQLGWRALSAASPDPDAGQLDLLLDWVRELEAGGADADAVLVGLAPENTDGPREIAEERPGTIACTTVHQAKGLAWDHVLVWSPGREIRGRDTETEPEPLAVALPGRPPARLVGLRFDPHGGLSPFKDPPGRLLSAIHRRRRGAEVARVLYVAVTRARRSVTLGLGKAARASPGRARRVEDLVIAAWGTAPFQADGVSRTFRSAKRERGEPITRWVEAIGEVPPARESVGPVWEERSPSDSHPAFSFDERRDRAAAAHVRAQLGGLHLGAGPRLDPPPIPGWSSAHWGTLAHAWMATWRFAGDPEAARIETWLGEERGPGIHNAAGAAWLAALSSRVRTSPWWSLVSHPGTKLDFECAFIAAFPATHRVSTGRLDLLVTRGKQCWIVDFKVGGGSPSREDPAAGNLAEGVPQLEAYRDALNTLGKRVDSMILWYLRTGTTFAWS